MIVPPPSRTPPAVRFASRARSRPCQSTPGCSKKRSSSAARNASTTTGGIASHATGMRRCSPICAISLPSRDRTCSGSCRGTERSSAASGSSSSRNWNAPANPSPTPATSAIAIVSRVTTVFATVRLIAKSGTGSLLLAGGLCIVARDAWANSSKGGDAKPPVYGFDPGQRGCRFARPLRIRSRMKSSEEPSGHRTSRLVRPSTAWPPSPASGWLDSCSAGGRASQMRQSDSPRTILFRQTLIYSAPGAWNPLHDRSATS